MNHKDVLLAHLRLKRELTHAQISVILGFGRREVPATIKKLVESLELEGEIIVLPADRLHKEARIRLPQPQRSAKRGREFNQCRVTVDPSLKGSWEPPKPKRQQEDDRRDVLAEVQREARIEAVKERKQAENGKKVPLVQGRSRRGQPVQDEQEMVAKCLKIAEELAAAEKPFSQGTIAELAGCSRRFIKEHKELRDKINELNGSYFHRFSAFQCRKKLNAAVDELIATGQPFQIRQICKIAGTSHMSIYAHRDILERAKAHLATLGIYDVGGLTRQGQAPWVRQRKERFLKAAHELATEGRPFTQREIAQRAGLSEKWIRRHPEVQEQVKAMIQASQQGRKTA